jgi:hypothetical protein
MSVRISSERTRPTASDRIAVVSDAASQSKQTASQLKITYCRTPLYVPLPDCSTKSDFFTLKALVFGPQSNSLCPTAWIQNAHRKTKRRLVNRYQTHTLTNDDIQRIPTLSLLIAEPESSHRFARRDWGRISLAIHNKFIANDERIGAALAVAPHFASSKRNTFLAGMQSTLTDAILRETCRGPTLATHVPLTTSKPAVNRKDSARHRIVSAEESSLVNEWITAERKKHGD